MRKIIAIVVLSIALVGFTFIGSYDAEAMMTLNGAYLNALSVNGTYLNALSVNGAHFNALSVNSIKFNTIGFKDISSNAKQPKALKAKDFSSNGLCLNGIILAGE